MATLDDMREEMQALQTKGDLRGIVKLRATIARDFPNTADAAEALFRLGLYFLFVENQTQAAMQTFEDAIKIKDSHWSKAARVSLASLYLREKKPQKAMLELRKAIGEKEPASVHTLSALSIMELVHEEAGESAKVREVKETKVTHLRTLVEQARSGGDQPALAFYQRTLTMELSALGLDPDASI
jgi:tetratricopeptide (TPR) repeat protein